MQSNSNDCKYVITSRCHEFLRHFRTYFGGAARHALRLVKTDDNTITLYHDANGDYQGSVGDGIIAFRLSDLPATDGKYKEITLKWNSFSGEKSVKFKYLKK